MKRKICNIDTLIGTYSSFEYVCLCSHHVVPSYVEVIRCRMQSCCMTHHENEIDTLMYIMRK
jgi:hypothetical protein